MTARINFKHLPSRRGDPPWEAVELFPKQGEWTEAQYMALIERRGIEYADGVLEVLPMPTDMHQAILQFLFLALDKFVEKHRLGKTRFSGSRIKVDKATYREPDILFVLTKHKQWISQNCWSGADLVMEVVTSPEGRRRDIKEKRVEYETAGIPEYWIVDPQKETIIVLKLDGNKYIEHGCFNKGQRATSSLLKGFGVDVSTALNAD